VIHVDIQAGNWADLALARAIFIAARPHLAAPVRTMVVLRTRSKTLDEPFQRLSDVFVKVNHTKLALLVVCAPPVANANDLEPSCIAEFAPRFRSLKRLSLYFGGPQHIRSARIHHLILFTPLFSFLILRMLIALPMTT
jgi:hypothetical protein